MCTHFQLSLALKDCTYCCDFHYAMVEVYLNALNLHRSFSIFFKKKKKTTRERTTTDLTNNLH